MANTSAGRTAKKKTKPAAPTWRELAKVTPAKERRWQHHQNRTRWLACGIDWDAVSVEPMEAGLDALTAMRAGTRSGYWVIADRLRDRLYVAVPTGAGDVFAGLDGVRLLSTGHQLLVPSTHEDATISADWVSHPQGREAPPLVDAERFAAQLRGLTAPVHERAPMP
ncbi:hypothetical protein [Streptomyces sp. NPDC013489]|uniref:hypothetical protein n=1 Tax=Streptomyces sp. NPDC013489 TaxID=3155606 RepID=UPI0033C6EAA6